MINVAPTDVQIIVDVFLMIIVNGRSKAISTSKIRKITAIKKNCSLNGIRDDVLGSKPHSKGDPFSRSYSDFFEIVDASIIRAMEIIRHMIAVSMIFIYAYSFSRLFDWKSNVLSILNGHPPHQ